MIALQRTRSSHSVFGDAPYRSRQREDRRTRYLEVSDLGSESESILLSYCFARFYEASGTSTCNGLAFDPVETGHPHVLVAHQSRDVHILPNSHARYEQFCGSALAVTHRAVDLTSGIPLCGGLALVVQLLAPGDADINLRTAVLEADPQGHKRHALLLR